MSPKTIALAAVSALGVAAALAGETMTSASTFLHIDTAQSPFWRTATNNTVEISVDYPDSATTASLEVRGAWGYSFSDQNLAEGLYVLTLPKATDARSEDVYELALSFDNGETRTAKFAVVFGVSDGGNGSTRCITPQSSSRWSRVHRRAVLPVPYMADALAVDGKTVETGLNGAAGWYAFGPLAVGETKNVGLSLADEVFSAELYGVIDGFRLQLR